MIALLVAGLLGIPSVALQVPPREPQGEVKKKLEDYKALIENNIFSPPKKGGAKPAEPVKATPVSTEPARPAPVVITGIYRSSKDGRYEVVLEDRKKKEIRTCRAGDTFQAWTFVSIDQERVVARTAERERAFKVGDPLDEAATSAPAAEVPIGLDQAEEARRRLREKYGKKPAEEDEEEVDVEDKRTPK